MNLIKDLEWFVHNPFTNVSNYKQPAQNNAIDWDSRAVEKYLPALSREWRSSIEIAERVGCTRSSVSLALNRPALAKLCEFKEVIDKGAKKHYWRLRK